MTRPSRPSDPQHALTLRAWYSATTEAFLRASHDAVLGQLAANSGFAVSPNQRDAWLAEIEILHEQLAGLSGSLFLEFSIPRMGKRIDAVLLVEDVVVAVEFKVGETRYERGAIEQVWDYALDLKNFHEASHSLAIVPVLIATGAAASLPLHLEAADDGVYRPVCANRRGLRRLLEHLLTLASESRVDGPGWALASYHPTPTIVEAARALYAQHSVEAIARFDAGAQNLAITSARIEEIVDEARSCGRKAICLVTGVPGAGKTLVGLNLATRRGEVEQPTHAVFLSGNGPLVAVLREALTRDELARRRQEDHKVRKGTIGEQVKAFIQNVHHFRDEALVDAGPPIEHVVIFDEAQRAWNARKTASFMLQRKRRPGFTHSEPEFLVSYVDRHTDWAVVVCLVGGGQEIHDGEAGIGAWLDALIHQFPDWHLFVSSRLIDSEYAAGRVLELVQNRPRTVFDDALHLGVSMRSFRAETQSAFVKALLDCDRALARNMLSRMADRYPMALTRDLRAAKQWVRNRARGTERFGLVASSKAMRLKPHAIDIRVAVDPVPYFLNDRDDTRSSFYLEDAATEFQIQGLELDWVCVTWDADLRFTSDRWSHYDFRGDRWCNINSADNRIYLQNAYRVLLTRARQGMVVFVPLGDPQDPTRSPAFYDSTFDYLRDAGIPTIE